MLAFMIGQRLMFKNEILPHIMSGYFYKVLPWLTYETGHVPSKGSINLQDPVNKFLFRLAPEIIRHDHTYRRLFGFRLKLNLLAIKNINFIYIYISIGLKITLIEVNGIHYTFIRNMGFGRGMLFLFLAISLVPFLSCFLNYKEGRRWSTNN